MGTRRRRREARGDGDVGSPTAARHEAADPEGGDDGQGDSANACVHVAKDRRRRVRPGQLVTAASWPQAPSMSEPRVSRIVVGMP